MPEDVDPKERIPALLAEWGAVKFLPGAEEAQAAIEAELAALGYDGPFEPGGLVETTEPEEMETAVPPKRRGRPPASGR